MPFLEHNKLNLLDSGWYVIYKDLQTIITEEDMSWLQVPNKKDIKVMGLKKHNKYYELVDKEYFIPPGETHCREIIVNPGTEFAVTKQTLIGWFIGYYEKNIKVLLRVSAIDRSVTTEKVPIDS
jgi:hypothetical protein